MGDNSEKLLHDTKETLDRQSELAAVLVLSIAALASAYSSFQAELWNGVQATNYTLAEQARTAASQVKIEQVQFQSVDAMLFTEWLDAYAKGDMELQNFYRERFRPPFRKVFEAWLKTRPRLNPKAPASPFVLPEYFEEVSRHTQPIANKASELFDAGQRANHTSDAYGQASLFLALPLFLGGVVQAFNSPKLRLSLISVAALGCIIGVLRLFSLPAIRLL